MLCTVLRENTLPETQQKNAIILCVEDTADFTVYIHSFHWVMRTTLNALICSHAWKTTKCSFFSKLKFIVFLSIYIEFFSYFPFDSRRFFPPSFLLSRFYEAELKFKNSAILMCLNHIPQEYIFQSNLLPLPWPLYSSGPLP